MYVSGGGGGEVAACQPRAGAVAVTLHPRRRDLGDRPGTDDVSRGTNELLFACVRAMNRPGRMGYCGGYHLPPTTLTGTVRGDTVQRCLDRRRRSRDQRPSFQPADLDDAAARSNRRTGWLMTARPVSSTCTWAMACAGSELVRSALEGQRAAAARVPADPRQPAKKALFEEAVALAKRGCHVDITAFPVEEGEIRLPLPTPGCATPRDSGAPLERVSISLMPAAAALFRRARPARRHGRRLSGALLDTLNELVARGLLLERAPPAFTRNVADLLRLPGKGRIAVAAMPTWWRWMAGRGPPCWLGGGPCPRGRRRPPWYVRALIEPRFQGNPQTCPAGGRGRSAADRSHRRCRGQAERQACAAQVLRTVRRPGRETAVILTASKLNDTGDRMNSCSAGWRAQRARAGFRHPPRARERKLVRIEQASGISSPAATSCGCPPSSAAPSGGAGDPRL